MQLDSRNHAAPSKESATTRSAATSALSQFTVHVTRDPTEIREAQHLRYKVFSEEMGAHVGDRYQEIDEDIFDAYCDHLIVRDQVSLRVVGTYRILPPHASKRLGFYSDTEFFTNRLDQLKPNLVEFGRSCVHPDFRSGPVIMQLWGGLAQYMISGGYDTVIGCASISMRDGGHQAASLFKRLKDHHLAPAEYQVFPRNPVPLNQLHDTLDVEAPPLINSYLRLGAKICGDPAWDPDFNSADFFMMLNLPRMNRRYAKHFGIQAEALASASRR